jgi:hypothetical protein
MSGSWPLRGSVSRRGHAGSAVAGDIHPGVEDGTLDPQHTEQAVEELVMAQGLAGLLGQAVALEPGGTLERAG